MPSAREIRRRIRSVRNTSQITKAMEMVSAAKLRRAQSSAESSRPYSEQLRALIATLGSATGGGDADELHPLLQRRPVRNSAMILVTPDRGLTGAMIGNVLRAGAAFVLERGNPAIVAIGRKGRDWMMRRGRNVMAEFTGLDRPTMADVGAIARVVTDDFIAGTIDEVVLVYTRFQSTSTQRPVRIQLLPIEPPQQSEESQQRYANFTFEPSPAAVLEAILPRYVEVVIFQALLESIASEHAARMIAMHNATENARDIVKSLTLTYNKARQAGITKEILEIVGGAEALKTA